MLLSPSKVSQSAPADWRPPGSFKGPSPVPSCVREVGRRAEWVCSSQAWNHLASRERLRHCSCSMEPRGPDRAPHRQGTLVLPATRSLTHRQQEQELLLYSLPDSKPNSGSHEFRQRAGKPSEAEEAPDGGVTVAATTRRGGSGEAALRSRPHGQLCRYKARLFPVQPGSLEEPVKFAVTDV